MTTQFSVSHDCQIVTTINSEFIINVDCFICQSGCMGIYRYAAVMSDFQRVKGLSDRNSSGCDAWNSLMESPRVLMPSSLTPTIDCRSIMELREYGPALWLTTKRSLSSGGFGTT